MLRRVADDVEAELRKMAEDPGLPAHLKLGVLKQLIALRSLAKPAGSGHAPVVMPDREDGLPPDPLLEEFPADADEHGRVLPADPMADLDWCQAVGRMPHAMYARVLYVVPTSDKQTLLDAEARFLREARNRGLDTEADEVADRRKRRQRNTRS
jgi:hypothetical protein